MRSRPTTHGRALPSSRCAAIVVCAALVLGACSSATAPRFHSLMAAEVAPRAAAGATRPAATTPILLEAVRVPVQVDQPQWVVRLPDESVAVLEQERWAGPLRDEFREALLEELIVGHGALDARTQPAPGPAAWRVAVDVRRFDSLPGREARIEGSWTIQGGTSRTATSRCEWLLREPASDGMIALAAAHRRAIARLADAIALAIARVGRGESPACPPADERR